MSFETISISRAIPLINGYAQVPPNRFSQKTAYSAATVLSLVPTASTKRLSPIGASTGSGFGTQEWIDVPQLANGDVPGSAGAVWADIIAQQSK